MKMKAWYFLCIFFSLYCLSTLVEESYDVAYQFENRTEEYEYLACFDLKKYFYSLTNRTEIDLNQLNLDIYNYFDGLEDLMKTRHLKMFNESILVPIRQRECLVFRGMFCIQAENETKLRRINSLFGDSLILFAYKNDTFDLIKISMSGKLDQQIVLHNSNCIEGYSRFHCLNRCFKGKNRLSKYFYRMNEMDGIIQLNYDNNNTTLKEDEDECFKECKINGCKFTYFIKSSNILGKQKINFFKAYPIMSTLDYWIKLAGLVFFFTGLSSYQILSKFIKTLNSSSFFDQILPKFIKLIRSKIQIDKLKRRLLNSFKAIIMVIMISFLIYSYIDLIMTYKHDLKEPIKKQTNLILLEPEPISLVICVLLHNIFTKNYDGNSLHNEDIFRNKSLLKLEKETEISFNDTLDEIHMVFQNEKIEAKWTLKPKVLFYKLFEFARCFLVDVFPSEPKYQSALSITKLVIKFKYDIYDIFLLPEGQSFHSNKYRFNRNYDFKKNIIISTKECKNYDRLNSRSPCIRKKDCLNRCYHQEFIKKHGNISSHRDIIIDKDHFTKEQWEKLFVVDKFDRNISTKCKEEITKKDCLEVNFERNIKITPTQDYKIATFDLYYDILKEVEIEPTVYNLLFDMVNIQSYFFGLNTFKLLFMIYLLVKNKLKFYLLITIYIICMLGSIYQTYYILNEIINEELDQSQHYKLLETLRIPEIIFCLDFNESLIDMNHKLTGNYLDEITKDIRAETVFDTIRYLDNNRINKWITLKSNFTGDQFRIEEFFFLNEKCFKIILEMEYHRDQFHFSFESNVLKIFFNQKFIDRISYFMTKPKDKIQFSKLIKLNFIFGRTILISQELFELTYYDKFNFIKNPLSLFYGENGLNDAAHYLNNLLNNFKRSFNNLRTLKFPLKENHFKFEVDDDLFEQYYLQVQNVTDNYLSTDSNYQISLATNYYHEYVDRKSYDFNFNLIFYKKKVVISNDDSSTKLVLNLLNILSFWFDLGILDIHIYFSKVKHIFVFIFTWKYQILLKGKKSIYWILNPQLIQKRTFLGPRNHLHFITEIDLRKN